MAGTEPTQEQRDARAEQAAERAKAAARDSAKWLGEEAQRLYAGYQQQSKYFKWRTWIGLAYAAIAIFSIVMALGPLNYIHAYVKIDYDYERRLLIFVRNDSPEEWTNVRLVLDDRYEFRKVSMRPNESLSQNITTFVDRRSSTPAKADARPRMLLVDTDQGSHKVPIVEDE